MRPHPVVTVPKCSELFRYRNEATFFEGLVLLFASHQVEVEATPTSSDWREGGKV